jgi:hypothetical protein
MLMLSTHEPILDVLVNRVVEEERILLYQAELCSPPIQISAVKVFVPDGDRAVAKVISNGIVAAKLVPSGYECDYGTYACDIFYQQPLS